MQSDPIGLAGGVNTFAYVGSSPLLRSDPHGLFFDANGFARAAQAAARVAPAAAAAAVADGPLPIGDLIAVGIVAGAVIYDLCDSRDDCAEINKRIERALSVLRQRYVAMTADKNRTHRDNVFGHLGWDNHRKAIEEWKKNLAKNVALAKAKGCPYNAEADAWLTRPPPIRPAY